MPADLYSCLKQQLERADANVHQPSPRRAASREQRLDFIQLYNLLLAVAAYKLSGYWFSTVFLHCWHRFGSWQSASTASLSVPVEMSWTVPCLKIPPRNSETQMDRRASASFFPFAWLGDFFDAYITVLLIIGNNETEVMLTRCERTL